jgi:hypothetical protein
VDWNEDGDMTDVITTGINVNGLVAPEPNDPEQIGATILFGHNDWANLFLNFRHSFKYREEFGLETGASSVAASEHHHADGGPTPDIVAELDDIGYTNRAVRIQGRPDVYANEGDTISFTVPAADPEGDALTFALAPGAPPDAAIHPTTGQFTWPTDADDGYGEYVITVQVTDLGSGRLRERNYGFVVDVGLTGDYNLNGTVDAADYVVWRKTQVTTGPLYAGADGSGNGVVDQADYLIWRANFGNTLSPPDLASTVTVSAVQTESIALPTLASTQPERRTVGLPVVLAAVTVQGARPRTNARLVAGRILPSTGASQDDALVAWLATRPTAGRWEVSVAAVGDVLSEPDKREFSGQPSDTLDPAFASLGV